MEALEADPAFGAIVGARALDVDMNYKFPFEEPLTGFTYGLSHIGAQDAAMIGARLVRSLAEEWAAYAKPGSPMALAGGNIPSDGPKVMSATAVAADTVVVKVVHDRASTFALLDPDAIAGVGWVVGGASNAVYADGVQVLSPDTLQIHFEGAIPADGLLHYGYGDGRLAGSNEPARGNAIYDNAGLPLWTPAVGVKVNAPAPAVAAQPLGNQDSPESWFI